MTDPVDNAIRALVDHFAANAVVTYNGVTAPFRIFVGWAETNQDVDLRTPFGVVTYFSEERQEHNPYLLNCDGPPPFRWHVADIKVAAQLDIFCPFRETRAEVGEVIRRNMHDDVPFRPGLHLTSADYYNSQITVHSGRARDSQFAGQAQVGEWRRTWDLTISCSEIVETNTPALSEVVLRVAPSVTLPPETTTIP